MQYKAILRICCITAFFVIIGNIFRGTIKEDFIGSLLEYKMGEGVKDSWDIRKYQENSPLYWSLHNHNSFLSKTTLPDNSLHFYNETEFHPKCCQNGYIPKENTKRTKESHKTTGCKCMTVQQLQVLSTRGGNHKYCHNKEDNIIM